MTSHSQENKHCVRRCPKIVSRFHPLILTRLTKNWTKWEKNQWWIQMQRWHHMGGSSRPRIKCWIMHQYLLMIQTDFADWKVRTSKWSITDKSRNTQSCSVVAIFNWFDSASDVVNAFRRGSLLSSSQLRCPKQNQTQKDNEKNNERQRKLGIGWLGSAG